jgi:peptidoglycan hydrolase-like protein with peptidoglycan-binding domain
MADQSEWHLGQTSAHYETGGLGAGTISTGKGDHGGVSYGSYQLSTNMGTLQEYLDQSAYKDQFKGLEPKTPAFNAEWKKLADTDPGFAKDQHDFIKSSHYDVQVAALKADGLDLTDRGPAVQDALWSTSVQFRGLTKNIFEKGLEEKFGKDYDLSKLSDKDIVDAAQDYKIEHNEKLFSKSPKLWDSLEDRARSEKTALETLAGEGKTVDPGERANAPASRTANPKHAATTNGVLKEGERSAAVHDLQHKLNELDGPAGANRKLTEDGKFGHDTKARVEDFQREHGLKVDGIAGSRTMREIDTLERQPSAAPGKGAPSGGAVRLDDPANPDYTLHEQARAAVHKLDAEHNRKPDQNSENLAAALVVAARRDGMTRIDHAVLSDDGSRTFAVQGDLGSPFKRIAEVPTATAVATPVEKSAAALDQQQQDPSQLRQHEQHQQTQRQANSAPAM